MPCLVVVETDGENELLYLLDAQPLKVFRRKASALRLCEEPSHCAGSARILRASGEDRPYENAERVLSLRLDEFDDRRRMGFEFFLQRTVDFWYVANFHIIP